MCGRYAITKPFSKTEKIVKKAIGVENEDNYNAHPQQKLPVIKQYVNGKTLEKLEWGLTPSWAKEKNIRSLINARLETLGEKISFKNLIKSYRCLIVADGYYEWKREKSIKTPHYFERQDDETIFFAGIYKTKQFCIVTREATSNVGDIHDRQPVIINKKDLVVPHPRFRERLFVLEPLNDIAPNFLDPITNKTINQLLINAQNSSN